MFIVFQVVKQFRFENCSLLFWTLFRTFYKNNHWFVLYCLTCGWENSGWKIVYFGFEPCSEHSVLYVAKCSEQGSKPQWTIFKPEFLVLYKKSLICDILPYMWLRKFRFEACSLFLNFVQNIQYYLRNLMGDSRLVGAALC